MMRIIKLFLFALPVFCASAIHAKLQGKARLDSMLNELPAQKEDTSKVLLLTSISTRYMVVDPEKGLSYGQQAMELASRLKFEKGVAFAYSSLASNYQNMSDYAQALDLFEKAYKIHVKLGDANDIADVTGNIGNIYYLKNDYVKAATYFDDALKIYQKVGTPRQIAATNVNLGAVYFNQSSYPKALEHYFNALKVVEESGDKMTISILLGNIGNVYVRQEDYTRALEYSMKALAISTEIGDKRGIAGTAGNIGSIYEILKNYRKATEYYTAALKSSEEIGYQTGIAANLKSLALVYTAQKDYVKALPGFYRALRLAQEIDQKSTIANVLTALAATYLDIYEGPALQGGTDPLSKALAALGSPAVVFPASRPAQLQTAIGYLKRAVAISLEIGEPETIKSAYESLARAYRLNGDYKDALFASDAFRAINDSLFSKENNRKVLQQGLTYEYEKKEAIAKLEQEKKDQIAINELQKQKLVRNGFMGGFAVVLVFAGIFFNQRNKITSGKKQSDELLLNILPAEVAEELKLKGSAEAKLIDEVTVLFTDFKGFTQLSEQLTPKELVAEINESFSAFDNITQRYGIEKIKTIGDAYMAAGGLPTPNRTHAQDVVKAAIEIQQYMAEHQRRKKAAGAVYFEIRIGVHTGPVVAGIVGVKKFAYDIWGDTVNTAARMEQNSEAGKINISQTTYELVKDNFACEYRGEIDAKHKGVMKMYYLSAGASA